MSTKHIVTGGDLIRFRASMRVECAECGNAKTWSALEFVQLFGTEHISWAQERMVCSRCRKRSVRLTVLQPL